MSKERSVQLQVPALTEAQRMWHTLKTLNFKENESYFSVLLLLVCMKAL